MKKPDEETPERHLVILLHGIRDHAGWMFEIRPALEAAGFEVALTNYGRFDLFRFLTPIRLFRLAAIRRVTKQIDAAIMTRKPTAVSYIAHSFGTFIVAHILKREPRLTAHRVILCGSVLKHTFPFATFLPRFTPPILNEVGTRDYWPAAAEGVTWGYGDIGTYGFRNEPVCDRVHKDAPHNFFLHAAFCQRYWVPFLRDGEIVPTHAAVERRPWWLVPLHYVKWLFLALLIFAFGAVSTAWYCRIPADGTKETITNGRVYVGQHLKNALDRISDACKDPCPTFLSGRTCLEVPDFDPQIERFVQCAPLGFVDFRPVSYTHLTLPTILRV